MLEVVTPPQRFDWHPMKRSCSSLAQDMLVWLCKVFCDAFFVACFHGTALKGHLAYCFHPRRLAHQQLHIGLFRTTEQLDEPWLFSSKSFGVSVQSSLSLLVRDTQGRQAMDTDLVVWGFSEFCIFSLLTATFCFKWRVSQPDQFGTWSQPRCQIFTVGLLNLCPGATSLC